MTQNSSRKKKKNRRQYSKGELNRLVDSLFHPFCDRSSLFMVVNTVLHGLIEQNPKLTVGKFARYTPPKIIEEILKGH